tara:strand:- start:677 stop:913 length:237 start_codon:yes stop_codon:yes gene_type:complete
MFLVDEKNVNYCVFIYTPDQDEAKVYTPFFQSIDQAEEYANYMRLYLPRTVVVTEPYPVVPEKASLEEEFSNVIKKNQ